MKVSPTTNKPKSGYQLCIGLDEPPKRDADDVDKAISFTCHRVPNDTDSPKYELKAYPFEDGGTCEMFIKTLMKMNEIQKGQNITTNADKVILAKQLFKGSALTAFESELPADGNVTNAQLARAFAAMPKVIFPDKALRNQKKALKKLKKPRDVSFREFANRVKVLNDYFPFFPKQPNGRTPTSLPHDELMELLFDALPKVAYQDVMQVHDYDPSEDTLQGFIEWVERRCEPFDAKKDNPPTKEKVIPKKKRKADDGSSHIREGDHPAKRRKWCIVHKYCDHVTDECKVVKSKFGGTKPRDNPPWKKPKPAEDSHLIDEPMTEAKDQVKDLDGLREALQRDMVKTCSRMFKALQRSKQQELFNVEKDETEHYEELLNLNKAPEDDSPKDMGESSNALTDEEIQALMEASD